MLNPNFTLLSLSYVNLMCLYEYKAIVNDILVSAPPPASEVTPARILSLLSHYFSFHNILSLFKQRSCYSELGM